MSPSVMEFIKCLGQHLARLTLGIALSGLAQRFPTLDLPMPTADIHGTTVTVIRRNASW